MSYDRLEIKGENQNYSSVLYCVLNLHVCLGLDFFFECLFRFGISYVFLC